MTTTVENISSVLRMYSPGDGNLGVIALPEAGTASIIAGDQDGCFYSFESDTKAREVHYYDFASGHSTLFSTPTQKLEYIAARRVEYPATDGTLIPLTVLGRQDILQQGNAPTLLTAYGAAGVCLTPQHSFLATCFIELGGVFAIAHIRGGGERGLAWEEAGKRRNRPTVHKDFLSAGSSSPAVASRTRLASLSLVGRTPAYSSARR